MNHFLKQSRNYQLLKNEIGLHNVLTITLLVSITMIISSNSLTNEGLVFAEGSSFGNQLLKVNVQITNNADVNENGSVHVIADGTGVSKDLNNILFPASKTVTHVFEFSSEDIPVGTGFSVEVVYGDDIHKRTYGINSESSMPENLDIVIP
jgi:hypothetical protein